MTDVREACIAEALAIIESKGVEGLSLREVSRRLGISHQAPYKHFASRDHILAEIIKRAFESFAEHLDNRPPTNDAMADLEAMGKAYLEYALEHPLQYRLMFNIPLPDPQQHPDMMHSAQHAFALLRDCLERINPQTSTPYELDALFIWSIMHGTASILHSHVFESLGLPDTMLEAATHHALSRIKLSLS